MGGTSEDDEGVLAAMFQGLTAFVDGGNRVDFALCDLNIRLWLWLQVPSAH